MQSYNIYQFFFVLVLLLLSMSAKAASYYMGGVCYSDTAVIVEVWESHFPAMNPSGNQLNYMAYPTTVSATGLMTYRVDQQNLQTGAVNPGNVNNVQLMDCTPKNDYVAVGKVERMLVIIGVVFAALFGFNVGRNFFPDKFGMGSA